MTLSTRLRRENVAPGQLATSIRWGSVVVIVAYSGDAARSDTAKPSRQFGRRIQMGQSQVEQMLQDIRRDRLDGAHKAQT